MIIHKNLKTFLEIIYKNDVDCFKSISERDLKKYFKNNEYYILRNFCIDNELISIKYRNIIITKLGLDLFNFLNKLRKI